MEEDKRESSVPFCSCTDMKCPFHPSNHNQGCTPCVAKNLKEREIPSCFFRKAGGVKPTEGWHFEDFAALMKRLAEEEDASSSGSAKNCRE